MTPALLAAFSSGGWSLGEILVTIVIIAALIGIAVAACNYFGFPIPPVVWHIFWIVVVAVLAILAIRFLLTL